MGRERDITSTGGSLSRNDPQPPVCSGVKDPDFLAETSRLNLDVAPSTGAEVEALIREVYTPPPEAVRLAAESMKPLKE